MRITILETREMRLVRPASIIEHFRAEDVNVINESSLDVTWGDQVVLEGGGRAFNEWLGPFAHVWFNFGPLQLEQFELINIREQRFKEEA